MKDLLCLQCGQINSQDSKKCSHCKQPPVLTKSQYLCTQCKCRGFNPKKCEQCHSQVQAIADLNSTKFSTEQNAKLAEQAEWLKVYFYQLISKIEIKITMTLVATFVLILSLFWLNDGHNGNGFILFIYIYMAVVATMLFNLITQMIIGRALCVKKLAAIQVKAEDKVVIDTDMPRALVENILHYRLSEMAKGLTRKHYQKLIPAMLDKYVEWKS